MSASFEWNCHHWSNELFSIFSSIIITTAQTQIVSQDLTTQKLLQETIDEALRESGDAGPKINFYSCHICSLTFVQENYYKQHMETHKREANKKPGNAVAVATTVSNANSLIRVDQRGINAQAAIVQGQNTNISDSDLEIMFEKMHSDKAEIEGNTNNSENLVITSQESSTGYTFNITMANQQEVTANNVELEKIKDENDALAQVGIDMPGLDQSEENIQAQQQQEEHQQHAASEQTTSGKQLLHMSLLHVDDTFSYFDFEYPHRKCWPTTSTGATRARRWRTTSGQHAKPRRRKSTIQ